MLLRRRREHRLRAMRAIVRSKSGPSSVGFFDHHKHFIRLPINRSKPTSGPLCRGSLEQVRYTISVNFQAELLFSGKFLAIQEFSMLFGGALLALSLGLRRADEA